MVTKEELVVFPGELSKVSQVCFSHEPTITITRVTSGVQTVREAKLEIETREATEADEDGEEEGDDDDELQ